MTYSILRSVTDRIGHDRLHHHLASILLTLECLVETGEKQGRPPKPDRLALPSQIMDMQVLIPLDGFMGPALLGNAPQEIQIDFATGGPRNVPAPESKARILNGLMTNLLCAQFVLFISEHWEWIRTKYGHDYTRWPATLDFARVVRNAASHGGCLEFQNPRAKPVTWRGTTYDPIMNGKKVIGPDLWVPDLLILMVDVSDILDDGGAEVTSPIWP